MSFNEIYTRRKIKIGDNCWFVDLGGGVALIQCDYVASATANQYTRIGTLPEGYLLHELDPDGINSYTAALAFRGKMTSTSIISAWNTGAVNVYTPTTEKYYSGQLVILYDRDDV